jgi:AcrR family transcriptional regulator
MAERSTRDRILRAAQGLYRAEGIGALSMRRVADGVGISATAVYRHFHAKSDLIDALAERSLATFTECLKRADGRTRRLIEVPRNYVDFALQRPKEFELIFLERRRHVTRYPDDLAAHTSQSFDVLHSVVAQEMTQRRLRKDRSLEVALEIWAVVHGLVMLYRGGRFRRDPAAFQALCRRAVLRLINGIGRPRQA